MTDIKIGLPVACPGQFLQLIFYDSLWTGLL